MTMYDYIIFDLDGTLSDPVVGITRSINHSLARHGYGERPTVDLLKYIGPPLDQSFASITGSSDSGHINSLVSVYRERYSVIGYAENSLYPGIEAALNQLSEAGLALGVCTSKRTDYSEKILEMFNLRKHFKFVSGGDIGVRKWQQLEQLLKEGTISLNSIMVGDRDIDITAAQKNGLHSAGVLWGYGDMQELSACHPTHIFKSPEELEKLKSKILNRGTVSYKYHLT